jgi:hypothetical protein
MKLAITTLVSLALMLACTADSRDESSSGGIGGEDGDTGDDGADGEDDGDDGDDGIRFDIADGSGDGSQDPDGDSGCKKVDFLFVIDSSGSMMYEQEALLRSFPGFIDAIVEKVELDDFQVMAIDTCTRDGDGCDGILGASQTKSGDGDDCGLVGEGRFATQAQPDLEQAFSCAANRGNMGSVEGNEQTMLAMTESIGPLNAAGECNEGFVRDDAIVVITVITDEEDDPGDTGGHWTADGECTNVDEDPNSPGGPQTWYDAVVAAKHGDPEAVVVLALIGDCDLNGECTGMKLDYDGIIGAEPAPRIREFAQRFQYGQVGPVCVDDYAPFFRAAVDQIDLACDEFKPPG